MFYYRPTLEYAYTDIVGLREHVPLGIMREMHRWGAHAMVITVWLHMFRVFMTGSLQAAARVQLVGRRDHARADAAALVHGVSACRGISWPSGRSRSDRTWRARRRSSATKVRARQLLRLGDVPLIHAADDARFALLGGTFVGEGALLRFYVLHCVGLPLGIAVLMAVHFWRVRKDGGISGPL